MPSRFQIVRAWYEKYERRISSASLFGGFIFDTLTLRRVDYILENLWICCLLFVGGLCIIYLNYKEKESPVDTETEVRMRFWTIMVMQFCFGGLFSSFLIFYFRSATLALSWPFLLLLVIIFVSNELYKKHYVRLSFQISIFFFAVYSFSIFLVPLFVRRIGTPIFLLSGLISLIILSIFLYALKKASHERFKNNRKILAASIGSIFIIINLLYFTNLIPPIPLTLQDVGMYHLVERNIDGDYVVSYEKRSTLKKVTDFLRLSETYHHVPGDRIFAYSAVFSPAKFGLRIVHQWDYFDVGQRRWVSRDEVSLPIVGGRDGGFRAYSLKTTIEPGLWRVRILTENGQEIGRVKFRLIQTDTAPAIEKEVKK